MWDPDELRVISDRIVTGVVDIRLLNMWIHKQHYINVSIPLLFKHMNHSVIKYTHETVLGCLVLA